MDQSAPKASKKLKIFLMGLPILFLIISGYFEFFGDQLNIYWLIAKYIFVILMVFTTLFYHYIFKSPNIGIATFSFICFCITFGFNAIRDFRKYNRKVCFEKFGSEFNQRRQQLGIPLLPTDWKAEFGENRSTVWQNNVSLGHCWKITFVDSTCTLEFERDNYNLKRINGVKRSISIASTLAKGKGKDTISFEYSLGDSTRTMGRKQADSIFALEKIRKDY